MPGCLPVPCARWPRTWARAFSSVDASERVHVRCGSAGHVSVDLFNRPRDSPKSALIVHLPPRPSLDGSGAGALPSFLEGLPVASINYRWGSGRPRHASFSPQWPTPIHDTATAFAWLAQTLAPPGCGRRDMYVYGSHLGAGLAVALSLTETHAHAAFGIRGLVAYNGVYNWTMFLPDHRINHPAGKAKTAATTPSEPAEGSRLHRLRKEMPGLFGQPYNLFDPFASPSLFFHSPGLLVPRTFSMSMAEEMDLEALTSGEDATMLPPPKMPRKSHLVFPPRQSTLKIPQTLLLHDAPWQPPQAASASENEIEGEGEGEDEDDFDFDFEDECEYEDQGASGTGNESSKGEGKDRTGGASRRGRRSRHTMAGQAQELAGLMRRSISMIEMKERSKWDDEVGDDKEEALRRVRIVDVGPETANLELNDGGQALALEWLQDRM
ncbi:hypothetical protein CDD83_9797 [Cordyceps sp. RAO-2017]|nr:hypothetical protein CDD83_9797 [Cordyceps sp. RAO-2017]